MRRLLLLIALIAVFSMAYQTSHAAKIAYMHGGTAPNANDTTIINYLKSFGHTVTTIPEAADGPTIISTANAGDIFILSASIGSGSARGKNLETIAVPMVIGEEACSQNNSSGTGTTGNGPFAFGTVNHGTTAQNNVLIDSAHAPNVLSANLSGSVTLFTAGATNISLPRVNIDTANPPYYSIDLPPQGGTNVYQAMIAIDAGGKLAGGATAQARRVLTHVTDANSPFLSPQGWRLFLAQVYWCLNQPLPPLLPTAAPTSVSGLALKDQPRYTTVTLGNPNTNSVSFNAFKIVGPAASVFSIESPKTLPLTLAGLQSGTIIVKALSTAVGVSTATLQLGYNNSASTLTVALSLTAAVYEPSFIPGVTATASTAESARPATYAVNGSGVTEPVGVLGSRQATHNNSNTTMWRTAGTADVTNGTNWILFDLGKVYNLSEMWVWNYNEISGSTYYNQRGAKNCTISYSTDGTNYTTLGTFDLGRTANLAAAPASNLDGTGLPVDFAGVPVRYVKIAVNSTWEKTTGTGFIGISEVRFYQFVPPPNKVRRWSLFE